MRLPSGGESVPVMKLPSLPHVILLFFLGFVFLHFMLAGARTFYSENMQDEPGAPVAQFSFVFSGVVPTWFLGLYHPIHETNGIRLPSSSHSRWRCTNGRDTRSGAGDSAWDGAGTYRRSCANAGPTASSATRST